MSEVRDLLVMEMSVDEEDQRMPSAAAQQPSWKRAAWAAVIGTALFLGWLGAAPFLPAFRASSTKGSEKEMLDLNAANTVESGQYKWQIVHTERDLCSTYKDNCVNSMCCKVSGYHCYGKNDTFAKCTKTCVPSATDACRPLSKTLTLVPDYMKPARSLFCFSVYTKNTGSPKKSSEKELLIQQLKRKVSIFACDEYEVYSDVEVHLGDGFLTKKVTDVNKDWHFAKRKTTGAWVNTGMFIQVWKAIGEAGNYMHFDWVVKADPDAVFIPERLKNRIQWMPRTMSGSFLQNCEYVDYGFFGNLEVFSHLAFSILIENVDKCRTSLPWKKGIKDGKYGPMGEDLFAEICMEKNGVDKVEAFDVTIDGACPQKRPKDEKKNKKWKSDCKVKVPAMHPFKKPKDWLECFDQTMAMK